MQGRELIEHWFQRVWLEQDMAAIDEMFSPRTKAEGMMDFSVTAADFEALVPAFLSHVEEPELMIPHVVEAGDWVAAFIAVRARALVGGAPIVATGQVMARIENGVFTEVYNTFDFLGFFIQLGLLPADTLPLCLAGERIGG